MTQIFLAVDVLLIKTCQSYSGSGRNTWRFRSWSVAPLPGSAPVPSRAFAAMPLPARWWAEGKAACKRAVLQMHTTQLLVRELYYKCTLLSLNNRIKEYLLLFGERLRLQLGEKTKKSLKIISRRAFHFPHPSATTPGLLLPISVFGLLHMDLLRTGPCSEQEFNDGFFWFSISKSNQQDFLCSLWLTWKQSTWFSLTSSLYCQIQLKLANKFKS